MHFLFTFSRKAWGACTLDCSLAYPYQPSFCLGQMSDHVLCGTRDSWGWRWGLGTVPTGSAPRPQNLDSLKPSSWVSRPWEDEICFVGPETLRLNLAGWNGVLDGLQDLGDPRPIRTHLWNLFYVCCKLSLCQAGRLTGIWTESTPSVSTVVPSLGPGTQRTIEDLGGTEAPVRLSSLLFASHPSFSAIAP